MADGKGSDFYFNLMWIIRIFYIFAPGYKPTRIIIIN